MADSSGNPVDLSVAQRVTLWHPLASDSAEVQRWRERIFAAKIRQPFRQAFREFYEVTEDERQTRMYSNRFAKVLMRQHQFASLCRARGWDYRLMSTSFDGANVPTKKFDPWNMRVEFYVDLPADRDGRSSNRRWENNRERASICSSAPTRCVSIATAVKWPSMRFRRFCIPK